MLLACQVVAPTATAKPRSAPAGPGPIRTTCAISVTAALSSNQPWVGEGVEMTAGSPHIHAMSTRKPSNFSNWPL